MKHDATDFELTTHLYIDGECVKSRQVRAGKEREFIGLRTGASTICPFKFQEVELVGMMHICLVRISILMCVEDPDVEDATIAPGMGTIELQAFRSRTVGYRPWTLKHFRDLPRGHISERSKKAGWHRVRSVFMPLPLIPPTCHWLGIAHLVCLALQTKYLPANAQKEACRPS